MQVTVELEILHVHPVPLAAVGVSPVGTASLTVTVLPFVAVPPLLRTLSVKVPVPPRVKLDAPAVLDISRSGPPAVFTVTEPLAGALPPPLTLAVFVSEPVAFAETLTDTVITG